MTKSDVRSEGHTDNKAILIPTEDLRNKMRLVRRVLRRSVDVDVASLSSPPSLIVPVTFIWVGDDDQVQLRKQRRAMVASHSPSEMSASLTQAQRGNGVALEQ